LILVLTDIINKHCLIMSTRKRNEKASNKTGEALPSEGVVRSKDDLPAKRPQKGMQWTQSILYYSNSPGL
jgi:hypothetical protein